MRPAARRAALAALAFALALAPFRASPARGQDDGLTPPDFAKKRPTRDDGALASELERARGRVEAERHLTFRALVPSRELDRSELGRFYEHDFEDTYGDGSDTEKAWKALGLLPNGARFRRDFLAMKSSAVMGFYLFANEGPYAKGTLHLVSENIASGGERRDEVLAHELAHALSDQNHGLERMRDAIPKTATGQRDADRLLALFALEEGTALIIGKRAVDPSWKVSEGLVGLGSQDPGFLATRSAFSYIDGARFVDAVLAKGGFELLEKVYADPPTSTKQILHPELYLERRQEPVAISIPDLTKAAPGDWRVVQTNRLGAFGVAWLVGTETAGGWEGDEWQVLEERRTGQVIAASVSTWETERHAAAFAASCLVTQKPQAGLPEGALVYAEQRGKDVVVLLGAKEEQLPALAAAAWKAKKTVPDGPRGEPRPAPSDHGNELLKILLETTSGNGIAEKKADAPAVVLSARLAPEGRRLAGEKVAKLEERARDGKGVQALGDGRFLLPRDGVVFEHAGDALTIGAGGVERVDRAKGLLRSLQPADTPGLVGALDRAGQEK